MDSVTGIIVLILCIFLFILLREVVMWYWKINEIIKGQYRTNFLLTKILYKLGGELSEDDKKKLDFK